MKNNSKNSIQEPPNYAIMFANAVFMLGILFFVLIVIFAIYKMYNLPENLTQSFYFIFILIGGISATLFWLGLRLNNDLKVNLSLLFISMFISVYAFETYLKLSQEKKSQLEHKSYFTTQKAAERAKQMGVPFDTRTKMEVLDDLNSSGVEAYPTVSGLILSRNPSNRNGLNTRGGKIFPLGGIANKLMVQDNESGKWMQYKGDKYGFKNPKSAYQNSKIDIMMTGDSFTEGWGVNSNENISAVLREFGYNVVNIGKAGNGPLLEFAALKEYAETIKPKIVLWLYNYTDIEYDLNNELKSTLLVKYLYNDNFSQNLMSRQDEINSVLINYVNEEYKDSMKQLDPLSTSQKLKMNVISILKLRSIRKRFKLTLDSRNVVNFSQILDKSRKIVSEWGGILYFVYLPDLRWDTIKGNKFHQYALKTARELDIPIIDMYKEVFEPHPDPLSLFPFRLLVAHYNAHGYRLVSEAIENRLKIDGFIPKDIN